MASPLSIFVRKKREGRKITMISLYDAPSAQIACDAGVDSLLVGDSMGNVILGHDSTIPVTMEAMLHHTSAVVRGVRSSTRPDVAIVADLPFGTYATFEDAVRNSVALMHAGAHAVKLETPARESERNAINSIIPRLAANGIPVMGHIGFTPQSTLLFEKIVQGRTWEDSQLLMRSLHNIKECFAVVLEAMTEELAVQVTRSLDVPTIGIGAGSGCDGQVLVWNDLVGLTAKPPKFVKRFTDTRSVWTEAAKAFIDEVESTDFPAEAHTYRMTPAEKEEWQRQQRKERAYIRDLATGDHELSDEDEFIGNHDIYSSLSDDEEELSREDEDRLHDVERFWKGQ